MTNLTNSTDDIENDVAINIAGATIYVIADGDGLDSNGYLTISSGSVYVAQTSVDNAALDYDNTGIITGGTVWAIGNQGMAQAFDTGSTQAYIMANVSGSAGDTITVTDSLGNVITSTTAAADFGNVVFSAADLVDGETYTITVSSGNQATATATIETTESQFGPGGPMPGGDFSGEMPDFSDGNFPNSDETFPTDGMTPPDFPTTDTDNTTETTEDETSDAETETTDNTVENEETTSDTENSSDETTTDDTENEADTTDTETADETDSETSEQTTSDEVDSDSSEQTTSDDTTSEETNEETSQAPTAPANDFFVSHHNQQPVARTDFPQMQTRMTQPIFFRQAATSRQNLVLNRHQLTNQKHNKTNHFSLLSLTHQPQNFSKHHSMTKTSTKQA